MSGYTVLKALKSKEMEDIVCALWEILTDYGIPKICQSDNGPEFVNYLMKQLVQLYGIDQRLITTYNPRADGLVECRNKEISRILKKQMKGSTDRWNYWLPIIQLSINLKESVRTGSKPFEIFFGRPFNSFVDYQMTDVEWNIADKLESRMKKLKQLHDVVWPMIAKRTSEFRKKTANYVDNSLKQLQPFKPGTKVMTVDQTRSSKWDPIYEGPYTVVCQTKGESYILMDSDGKALDRRMTVQMLKPVDDVTSSGGRMNESINNNTDSDDKHYEVSGILNHRLNRKKKGYDYLVRWKNTTEDDDSWVNESDFDDMAVIKRYWKQVKEGKIELPKSRGHSRKITKSGSGVNKSGTKFNGK